MGEDKYTGKVLKFKDIHELNSSTNDEVARLILEYGTDHPAFNAARIDELEAENAKLFLENEYANIELDRLNAIVASLPTVPKIVPVKCKNAYCCDGEIWENGKPIAECYDCHGSGRVPVLCGKHDAAIPSTVRTCDCYPHGYATERVVVVPGMEVWYRFNNKKLAMGTVFGIEAATIWIADGLGVGVNRCYADEATAKLLGGE